MLILSVYYHSLKSSVKTEFRFTVTLQPLCKLQLLDFHSTHVTCVKASCEKKNVFWGFFFQYSSVYSISRHQQPLNLPMIRQTNPDLQPVTPALWLRNVSSRGWTQTFPHWSVSAHSQWLMFLSEINWQQHTRTHTHTCTCPQLFFQMLKELLSLLGAKQNFPFNENKEKKMPC